MCVIFNLNLTNIWQILLCKITLLQETKIRPTDWTFSYRSSNGSYNQKKCENSKVQFEKDKIICILNRATCNEEECKKYEEKVECEIELSNRLDFLGKVVQATNSLSMNDKIIFYKFNGH